MNVVEKYDKNLDKKTDLMSNRLPKLREEHLQKINHEFQWVQNLVNSICKDVECNFYMTGSNLYIQAWNKHDRMLYVEAAFFYQEDPENIYVVNIFSAWINSSDNQSIDKHIFVGKFVSFLKENGEKISQQFKRFFHPLDLQLEEIRSTSHDLDEEYTKIELALAEELKSKILSEGIHSKSLEIIEGWTNLKGKLISSGSVKMEGYSKMAGKKRDIYETVDELSSKCLRVVKMNLAEVIVELRPWILKKDLKNKVDKI